MATLHIIAGPNGAGKSTNSAALLEASKIIAFDFDKEFLSRWKSLGFDPSLETNIEENVKELFAEQKSLCLREQKSFAYETNFHSPDTRNTIAEFRKAGFQIELTFLFLKDVDAAIERVKQRVATGGHAVDEETINDRFYAGLQNLDDSFQLFDQVYLYFSKPMFVETIGVVQPREKMVSLEKPLPEIFRSHLPKLSAFLNRQKDIGFGL